MDSGSIKFHPICLRFPAMSEAEFDALVEDIRANGLRDEIVLFEGMVLDGRHRLGACRLAGIEPRFEEFQGDRRAALRFAASKNLQRRSLTESQRAAIAADLADELEREDAKAETENPEIPEENDTAPIGADDSAPAPRRPRKPRKSRTKDAAKDANASVRSTQKARRVKAADPELHERVKAGEIKVDDAVRQIDQAETPVEPVPLTPEETLAAKRADFVSTAEGLIRLWYEICDLDRDADRPGMVELLGKVVAKGKGQKRRVSPAAVDETDRYVLQLWTEYPRHEGKGAALKAIKKALDGTAYIELLAAVREYAEAKRGEDPKLIPHPATWFNQRRWEDDRTLWHSTGGGRDKLAGLRAASKPRDVQPAIITTEGSDDRIPF